MRACSECGRSAKKVARGLCPSCYSRHRKAGTLIDIERSNQRVSDVLEDWEALADPLLPVRAEAARLAPQFGMREERLENIIYSNLGSRFEGGWGERIKAS